MKSSTILVAVACLFGLTAYATAQLQQCSWQCTSTGNVSGKENSSYIFDMYLGTAYRADLSLLYSSGTKVFGIINYDRTVSAAFHIGTPYITWTNLTSNYVLIINHKTNSALLMEAEQQLEGILNLANKTIDVDLWLMSLINIVQNNGDFKQGSDVVNITQLINFFYKDQHNPSDITENLNLAKKIINSFELWFDAIPGLITNDYIRADLGIVGLTGGVINFYQKSMIALIALFGQAYSIDIMTTDIARAITKIFTNQVKGSYVSLVSLENRLKTYPDVPSAVNSLLNDTPLDVSRQVKVVKNKKYSYIVVTSIDIGYSIIISSMADTLVFFAVIYSKPTNNVLVFNHKVKTVVVVNTSLKMFAIFNFDTSFGIVVSCKTSKSTVFQDALAAKYIDLSFTHRGIVQINSHIKNFSQSLNTTSSFDFKLFLQALKDCKKIESCDKLAEIVPASILTSLRINFENYFDKIYEDYNVTNITLLDSIRPICNNGINVISVINYFIESVLAVDGDISKVSFNFLQFVNGSILNIISNETVRMNF